MSTRAELEAAIIAAPLDPTPRMVYGDWLQSRGDPLGEWVAMMAAIEAAPGDTRLRSAAVTYLDVHRTAILGAGATVMAGAYPGWRGGFLDQNRPPPTRLAPPHEDSALWRQPAGPVLRHV